MSGTYNIYSNEAAMPADPAALAKGVAGYNERLLPIDFQLSENDVILGRGCRCFNHKGNVKFRKLVENNLDRYMNTKGKSDKTAILCEIVNYVRSNSPHGGFVRKIKETGRFIEVGDFLAREKTSQAFRDALHDQYKSSNFNKKSNRLMKQVTGLSTSTKSRLSRPSSSTVITTSTSSNSSTNSSQYDQYNNFGTNNLLNGQKFDIFPVREVVAVTGQRNTIYSHDELSSSSSSREASVSFDENRFLAASSCTIQTDNILHFISNDSCRYQNCDERYNITARRSNRFSSFAASSQQDRNIICQDNQCNAVCENSCLNDYNLQSLLDDSIRTISSYGYDDELYHRQNQPMTW